MFTATDAWLILVLACIATSWGTIKAHNALKREERELYKSFEESRNK